MTMFHYTNQNSFNSIRSQVIWTFKAHKPPCDNPAGAYFTNLSETTPLLAAKLRIPRDKIAFIFSFIDVNDLRPLPGGRGKFIFFSPNDYKVMFERQLEARGTMLL
jgi:hypothetical protein